MFVDSPHTLMFIPLSSSCGWQLFTGVKSWHLFFWCEIREAKSHSHLKDNISCSFLNNRYVYQCIFIHPVLEYIFFGLFCILWKLIPAKP